MLSLFEIDLYSFTLIVTEYENTLLTFLIKNKPIWASFDTNTGELFGTPTAENIGTYVMIGISVNDGVYSNKLQVFNPNMLAREVEL